MSSAIRLACIADVGDIVSLIQQYWEFEHIPGFDRSRITALLSQFLGRPEQGACWLAEGEGGVEGYLLAVYMFSLEHGGTMAEIDELFVVPDKRALGIGAALLLAADRDMARAGLTRIQLQLGTDNPRGRIFYEQHGFGPRSGYELWDKPLRKA
jgi:GNAT superfamily N-acetyltransferase